jgi:hypothetical protein
MMVVTDVTDLPPTERIRRYIQLADDALEGAERCNRRVREAYLTMAKHWENLAVSTTARLVSDVTRYHAEFELDPDVIARAIRAATAPLRRLS